MQKLLIILLMFALTICFSACSGSTIPAGGAAPEAVTVDEQPAEADETANSESEQLITGTVAYYDGMMLVICSLDNRSLNFLVADSEVDMSKARGLKAGSETDIYYTGEISGHDTSAARVTRLVQSSEQSAVRPDISVTAAVIAAVNDSELTVMTFDGAVLTFSIADDDIDITHTGELTEEHYVTVFYEGETAGENAEAVRVIKLVQ